MELPAKICIQAYCAPKPGHIPFCRGLGLVGGEQASQKQDWTCAGRIHRGQRKGTEQYIP